jgi:hypothetical protein
VSKVEVHGAKELRRQIASLGDEVAKAGKGELKSAYMAAARVVEVAALAEVPVRKGRLKKSIRSMATPAGSRVAAGRGTVPYANAVHWGYKKRPDKAKKVRGGPIAPNKFLMRARDDNAGAVADALAAGVGDVIRRRGL